MQELPLDAVGAAVRTSDEKLKTNTVAFRISIWRFLLCTLPLVLCAVASITTVHVCKNQGFVYGAAIAAMWAVRIYLFNFCLVVAMIVLFLVLLAPFCSEREETKALIVRTIFNAINIFNVFLSIILTVVVICIVSLERRKYDIGKDL
ncbi:uncharacterized protein LOC132549436 [Ylistrum balloti]|uniref:uncharacterized protein LOC132549436 n=1 Tax=Ylistrum balloti TaxID=509963 RepID=UPI002905DD14|nr:uncharacterized protein LOC132549436 [Ylistrum balloti]